MDSEISGSYSPLGILIPRFPIRNVQRLYNRSEDRSVELAVSVCPTINVSICLSICLVNGIPLALTLDHPLYILFVKATMNRFRIRAHRLLTTGVDWRLQTETRRRLRRYKPVETRVGIELPGGFSPDNCVSRLCRVDRSRESPTTFDKLQCCCIHRAVRYPESLYVHMCPCRIQTVDTF